jgi:hypothetical protein
MPSVPVRLSATLADRARDVAAVENRSLTEQVEHWARLGELVESVLSGLSVRRLKTVSHDESLRERLAAADTKAGRQRTARLVRERGGPRYGIAPDDPEIVIRYDVDGRETRGTVIEGEFVPSSSPR